MLQQFQHKIPLFSNETHVDKLCAASGLCEQYQACSHLAGLNDATEKMSVEWSLLGENCACLLL